VGDARSGSGAEPAEPEQSAERGAPTAAYLAGATRAVALGISEGERLEPPLRLAELGLDRPPRSYFWSPPEVGRE
jgi:predicted transcriptional regulator